MLRFISRAVLVLAAVGLVAPSVMTLEGCAVKLGKTKGGGEKGAAAKTAGQKSGGTAKSNESKGADKGADYEEVTCDASSDGVGWCDDEHTIVFCDGGHFWALDCGQIESDVCGEDVDLNTVDCYATTEFK